MGLKVAFIVGRFPARSATFILNQVLGLMQLGCEVTITALAPGEDGWVPPEWETRGLAARTRYFAIPRSRPRRLARALRLAAHHFRRHPLPILGSFNPLHMPSETLRMNTPYYLVPFLGESPDVLLCHFGPSGRIGALLKGLGVPGRLVTVFHGYDLSRYLQGRSSRVYARLFSRGDLFLPVSDYWRRELIRQGLAAARVRVHHMGVSLRQFQPPPPGISRQGPLLLLTLGRMVEKKGHAVLLRALARLQSNIQLHCTLAGDGPLRPGLQRLAAHLGLGGRVDFSGAVSPGQARELFRKADIFVLPSLTAADGDREGIPMVLMEAMATGIPVISTRHSGIPELVTHGESGLLAEEGDVDSLAACIFDLAQDAPRRRRMGAAGRSRVARDFNLDVQNHRLLELLQNCVRS